MEPELADDGSDVGDSWDARVARAMSKLGDARASQSSNSARRQQRQALRTLIKNTAVGDCSVSLRTLHAIIRRCTEEPGDARWRRLRLANPRVEREVAQYAGGVEFLRSAGFAPTDFGTVLVLPSLFGRPDAVRQLHAALASLHAAALALPGGGLELPAVDLGPSRRAALGLVTVLTSDDLRQAVFRHLRAVDIWPLRKVAKAFITWTDIQLAELQSLSVEELLLQSLVPRREFAPLIMRCTSMKSLQWRFGGNRATPRHADALARQLASGLRCGQIPVHTLKISGQAGLSWNGLAEMLITAGEGVTSGLQSLEFIAGEIASQLTELADRGEPAIDTTTGVLLGHRSGVVLARALQTCVQLKTIAFAGGGGDAGPNRTSLAALGAWCPTLQSLSLDGCISIDGDAITTLVDGTTTRAALATSQHRSSTGIIIPGLGQTLSQSQCPDGPTRLCSTLTHLDVSGCIGISDVGLQALQRAGVRLQVLRANDCRSISDAGACCVATKSLTTLELASRRQIGDQTLCSLAVIGAALTVLDVSSGHGDALPLSSDALLKLVDGCPRMVSFRAAYATVSAAFIERVGIKWSASSAATSDDLEQGLTQLDLSFCRIVATDDAVTMCETLAHALCQCSHIKTLALAGFAAMQPDAIGNAELLPQHPADAVIEAALIACPRLTDLNFSETDIGAGILTSTLLSIDRSENTAKSGEETGFLRLARVNFSGCRRLGGESFVALLRTCPDLIDLNLGYCCNEDCAQGASVACAPVNAPGPQSSAGPDAISSDARVITDSDLSFLRNARCVDKLQALRLGGMGSRIDIPWPTVGDVVVKAFGNDGVAAALSKDSEANHLPALRVIDLANSSVTNQTIVGIAVASPKLSRLNVVGSKCTRELRRMLKEVGCGACVFGV